MDTVIDELMASVEHDAPQVAGLIVEALVAEIPAYTQLDAAALRAVREIAVTYVQESAQAMRDRRDPSAESIEAMGDSARARARDGLSLEDVLHALRVGFRVLWGVMQERMKAGARDLDAALTIGTRFLQYFDLAATTAARHYLDEMEQLTASADRRHSRLIATLLRSGTTAPAAQELAAELEVALAPRYWVLLVAPLGEATGVARTLRRLPLGKPVLAAPDGDAVLALWPANLPALERAYAALTVEHGPLLIAIGGSGAEDLDRAAIEARAVRRVAVNTEGLVRLDDVLLDALVHQTGDRTEDAVRALVDPLTGQEARAQELCRTLEAYIEANMSVRGAAERLNVHRNTVNYRLAQVWKLTGRDPRTVTGLFLLHAGLRLG